ncbi:MarR family transcriptional regulator [Coraliomargarita sp. SDUM461004]|uniref:MarR family transcriptional regulator n=1 Tax=Thalassobacterium sedimentorum TaxID=3041258 RepID=A0ABU1ANY6_9BACT|nr:MarR family transcriptional regulator [Coraliomargarita sp. SDUM461004]MDQ8195918.1 MarR family transcriptional regulator [Coraliomargarita sp. SDUM461004]
MKSGEPRWDFFTNHAHVIFYLSVHPDQPLRKVALAIGITERAVQRIVAELEEAGYLQRTKTGRQNRYEIDGSVALRHSTQAHRPVQELLDWAQSEQELYDDPAEEFKALENWSVGEHGSEVSR